MVTYLAGMGYGTFGPDPGSRINRVARSVEHSGIDAVGAADAANVAMFVPFGLLFPLLLPALRRWTMPAAVALSACIELVQLTVLTHRSPQWTDIWWNGWGAVIGFAVFLAAGWAMRSWRGRAGVR